MTTKKKEESWGKKEKVYCKDCEYCNPPIYNWDSAFYPGLQRPPVLTTDCIEPHGIYIDTPRERILMKNIHMKNKDNHCIYYKKKKEEK